MKKNGRGQAPFLTKAERAKIRKSFLKNSHKLFWDIAIYTGERWGAIAALRVDDVYYNPVGRKLLTKIVFRKEIRKNSGGKEAEDRQLHIVEPLRERLKLYEPPNFGYLFPSPTDPTKHISTQAMDKALRSAIARANLEHKGISSHSTRVSFANDLLRAGTAPTLVQAIVGWSSMAMVSRYSRNDDEMICAALAAVV